MLADAIVVIHLAVVLFVIAGLPLIYVGVALRWAWVRDWRWRALHLGAIGFVAAEPLAGIVCPLTVWEDALRQQQTGESFIEGWVDGILFYDLPTWAFTLVYTAFAALVALTWVVVPPTKRRRKPPGGR
jgi:polyferredoxin